MSPKIIVFISGSGTNLQAIIEAIAAGTLDAEISLVVSNRQRAHGLNRAKAAQIPTLYFPLKPYTKAGKTRETYDSDLAQRIKPYQPDLIVLAGWMHIFSPAFLNHFPNKVINLHPALPGQFPGIQAIERAFDAYKQGEIEHSGCMIHYVIPEVDAGPVVNYIKVPFQTGDTLTAYETRIRKAEHGLIVSAIRQVFGQPAPG